MFVAWLSYLFIILDISYDKVSIKYYSAVSYTTQLLSECMLTATNATNFHKDVKPFMANLVLKI